MLIPLSRKIYHSLTTPAQDSTSATGWGRIFQWREISIQLERAWEGVKNFFATLWQMLTCQTLTDADEPTNTPVVFPSAPITTPPPSSTSAAKPLVSPTAAVKVKKEEPRLPPYLPLETLRKEREGLVSPSDFIMGSSLPQYTPYGLLDTVKKSLPDFELKLPPYAGPQHFIRVKERFVETLSELYRGFLIGEVKIVENGPVNTYQGEFSHPTQIVEVREFIKNRLDGYNNAVEQHQDELSVDPELFFKPFCDLDNLISCWTEVWAIAEEPLLTQEQVEKLKACCDKLPDSKDPLYAEFPLITDFLKMALAALATKPLIGECVAEDLEAIRFALQEKFAIACGFMSIEQRFLGKLSQDGLNLFQLDKEDEGLTAFEIGHVEQIRHYLIEEIERFNKIMQEQTEIPLEPLNAPDFVNQLLEGVEILVEIWAIMIRMLSSKRGTDEKLELLTLIAHMLPEKESPIWTRFPVIKEAMAKTLLPLSFSHFSPYIFQVVAPIGEDNLDQVKKVQFESAHTEMVRKFGGEQNPAEIEMFVDNDDEISDALAQANCQKNAQEVQKVYYDTLVNFGNEGMAAAQAADNLKLRLKDIQDADRAVTCEQILGNLSEEVRAAIEPHLE